MATEQAKHMAELFASVSERTSKPGLDLASIRDISERLHLCGTEPEGITYAEVDADGVHALWCIPEGSDTDHVLRHCHNGGESSSRYTPTARPPGILPEPREFVSWWWTLGLHRNTRFPLRSTMWKGRTNGCLPRDIAPRTLSAVATLSAAILP